MATSRIFQGRIKTLRAADTELSAGKENLLALVDEAELPEEVYNSNAIENSTLTLRETEAILLDAEVTRKGSVREIFEAKNLARVIAHKKEKIKTEKLTAALILQLHKILMSGIDDNIAGRFRQTGEYVRVGAHIAPAPEHIAPMIDRLLANYAADTDTYFSDKIARFHLFFERIHPFCDGNGRIGRVIINFQLSELGLPRIIIRNKNKPAYYRAFVQYNAGGRSGMMENIVQLAVTESLHKRLTYLRGEPIIALSDYIRRHSLSAPAVLNAARRQTIPAFCEREKWKISQSHSPHIIEPQHSPSRGIFHR